MFSFKIQIHECKNSNITFWNFKIFCKVWFFLTMESSESEGLPQLYLELADAWLWLSVKFRVPLMPLLGMI